MNTFVTLIAIAVVAVLVWELVKIIAGDGYGHRPPPPSHHEELEPGSPRRWVNVAH